MPELNHDSVQDMGEMETEEGFQFPPGERRVVTQPLDLSVSTLVEQWNDKQLILPPIQREYVWDIGKASRLIESLLLNIPIPALYFAENHDAQYEIIDGHQRVRSIVEFMNNQFALGSLGVLSEYKGLRFHQLPAREQRFMRMRTLRVILISIESHPNMKFEIFERLNTGAILLNAQELRNSIYRGPFNELLHELVKDRAFRDTMGTKNPRKRMADQELILRFFAMSDRLDAYRTPLKRFMNEYMHSVQNSDEEMIAEYRTRFQLAVSRIMFLLGDVAFRVTDKDGRPTESVINRALFDAQMLAFLWINEDVAALDPNHIKAHLAQLFSDESFVDAIQRATGDRSRTYRRVRETVNALGAAGVELQVPFELGA